MVATTEREHAVMKGEYNKQIRYTCAYVGCLLSPCMLTYRILRRGVCLTLVLCVGRVPMVVVWLKPSPFVGARYPV